MYTTATVNAMLDTAVTAWGTLTIALSTTIPTIDDAQASGVSNVTEPSGGSYARVSLPTSSWAAAVDRIKATNADVAFAAPTGDWGKVVAIVAYSGTTARFIGLLDDEMEILSGGDSLTIPAGQIALALPLAD